MMPTRGIFANCCARAASGHAAAAPPSSVMNSRRFMSDMGAPPPYANAGHQKAMALRSRFAAPLAYHGGAASSSVARTHHSDPFLAAQLSNAVLAAQAVQHNA